MDATFTTLGMERSTIIAFYIAFAFYLLATILYTAYMASRNDFIGRLATGVTIAGLVANTVSLVVRTLSTGYAPFTNMWEFTVAFVWGIVLIYLVSEYKYKLRLLGVFVLPVAFILMGITAVFFFDSLGQKTLVAALQSKWLVVHVGVSVISYGAYAVSFGLAIMYLIRDAAADNPKGFVAKNFPALDVLDEMAYRAIAFAFPFLSLVIISGAIWAEYAWGRYWSWDPKETWSLITWLVYAAYLHARFTYGWRGKKAAWMALIGFATVLFTYFGVNLLLKGIHSYT